jgi:hypothetical protein
MPNKKKKKKKIMVMMILIVAFRVNIYCSLVGWKQHLEEKALPQWILSIDAAGSSKTLLTALECTPLQNRRPQFKYFVI